jgi:hypothetical protein
MRVSQRSALISPAVLGALLLLVSAFRNSRALRGRCCSLGSFRWSRILERLWRRSPRTGASSHANRLSEQPCQIAAVARLLPRLSVPLQAMALILGAFVIIPILAESCHPFLSRLFA